MYALALHTTLRCEQLRQLTPSSSSSPSTPVRHCSVTADSTGGSVPAGRASVIPVSLKLASTGGTTCADRAGFGDGTTGEAGLGEGTAGDARLAAGLACRPSGVGEPTRGDAGAGDPRVGLGAATACLISSRSQRAGLSGGALFARERVGVGGSSSAMRDTSG